MKNHGEEMYDEIDKRLNFIYDQKDTGPILDRLKKLLHNWEKKLPNMESMPDGGIPADQNDSIMITYGDNIQSKGMEHLEALLHFARERLEGVVSGIHILPFSPYSSDDGFSVMDYRQVNPKWGKWNHISIIAEEFKLMADLVLNHCSAQGTWFQDYLSGSKKYSDYFIEIDPDTDLSQVFRPRALPLLHEFDVNGEKKWIWTTFSADQVDLNFSNPQVLLEFVDILLDYVSKGVRIIRLDAVGFLWKEIGTNCMHHPKTHEVIKLFRTILNAMAPQVILITETNVPHKQNITYFGNGNDEAHMVYQFPLPPLTLDAFIRGDASKLTEWASSLPASDPKVNFFNFLASHDGIGVLPTRGYLSEEELENLVSEVQKRQGLVSYKSTPEGDIPYELNINYRDAVAEETLPIDKRAKKFLASQAVMLAMAGIPGIYIHSLLGSGNWKEGLGITGINRSINREKLDLTTLTQELDDPTSLRSRIFDGYKELLKARSRHAAFHPSSGQTILDLGPQLFALIRKTPEGKQVLCLQSVCAPSRSVRIPSPWADFNHLKNLVTGMEIKVQEGKIELHGWDVLWIPHD